jgi:hypothetical protein
MVPPGSAASAPHALGNIFRRRQKRRAGSAGHPGSCAKILIF